jgi:hypothetical protein
MGIFILFRNDLSGFWGFLPWYDDDRGCQFITQGGQRRK